MAAPCSLQVILTDSLSPLPVAPECVERSPVLQRACVSDGVAACVRLPCELSVWEDWANETHDSKWLLAVVRVRAPCRLACTVQRPVTLSARLHTARVHG